MKMWKNSAEPNSWFCHFFKLLAPQLLPLLAIPVNTTKHGENVEGSCAECCRDMSFGEVSVSLTGKKDVKVRFCNQWQPFGSTVEDQTPSSEMTMLVLGEPCLSETTFELCILLMERVECSFQQSWPQLHGTPVWSALACYLLQSQRHKHVVRPAITAGWRIGWLPRVVCDQHESQLPDWSERVWFFHTLLRPCL